MKNSQNLKAKWIRVLDPGTGAGMPTVTKRITPEKKGMLNPAVNLQIKKKKPQNNDS